MAVAYRDADEVKKVAESLLEHHRHLGPINGNKLDSEIAFVFRDKPIKSRGKERAYSIKKCSPLNTFFHGRSFIIEVDEDNFFILTADQRKVMVDEMLSSIKLSDKTGDLALVAPDATVYVEVLLRHHPDITPDELAKFLAATCPNAEPSA